LLRIFNSKGQIIRTLVNEYFSSGNHSITWNGFDENNNQVPSGVYFYQLVTDEFSEMKKMSLVR
jgi:flagellar hook assembly protein FlgD